MSMDWDKLKVFHAAAEAGSFTHAGEQLGLSQSAVSRQVSALEQELSVSLFHRHARGLILTEQGELLYRTAHEVFMKLEAARAKLTDSRERPNGDLRVTTTPGIGIGSANSSRCIPTSTSRCSPPTKSSTSPCARPTLRSGCVSRPNPT
jgi:DNA-binding transcriptional LysR family regulator